MFSHRLSKLSAPRAADWRCWNVSLCLSLLAEGGVKVINISDEKVNFGDFSADNLSLKDQPLFADIYVLFAGNDTEHVEPILGRTREILVASKNPASLEDAANALDLAYSERLHQEICLGSA